MKANQNSYPLFEANQVLTRGHLNTLFTYQDEQSRLTRANLIGIGIVCGLEIALDKTNGKTVINVSQGCGITSEGYLITLPDMQLVSFRAYTIPNESDYAEFRDNDVQFLLWELFPVDQPNGTTSLGDFNPTHNTPKLEEMAVLLFLEFKKQSLNNCSLNNCDGKGSEVTSSFKPMLIKREELAKLVAAENGIASGALPNDLETKLMAKLNLPDIRMPRFDVPNTSPVTTGDIFNAFLNVFRNRNSPPPSHTLVEETGNALSAAYQAFKPLLQKEYYDNPFSEFETIFGFLDDGPPTATVDQLCFLQYYYDLFDDLLRAYDEFRWEGVELLCACCPPEALFSRHLTLGLLTPKTQPDVYRRTFLSSPAVGNCSEQSKEVLQLFRRLVEMTRCFKVSLQNAVRITPSTFGPGPLSEKAIPYYYQQNGNPPLYQLWNYEKTQRNRANLNLGYRFEEYIPEVPDFVSKPLNYDLEPYNFLRIEGHLGKNYRGVLDTLRLLISQNRLPIDVIAIPTGNAENQYSLKNFLKTHPGIQHKAGVPLGGTFVLVFHDGKLPVLRDPFNGITNSIDKETIIADFYLPDRFYEQFVLPLDFEVNITGPTNHNTGLAPATVIVSGGSSPYSIQIDHQSYKLLNPDGRVSLPCGRHTLRIQDVKNLESAEKIIEISSSLSVDNFGVYEGTSPGNYYVSISITGGKRPYSVKVVIDEEDNGIMNPVYSGGLTDLGGDTYKTPEFYCRLGPGYAVIEDSNGCGTTMSIT